MSNVIQMQRPTGLVPGSAEWLREVQGPKLIKRLADEVEAAPVGEMTPTQARCAAMLLDRVLPAMSSVHHTIETDLSRLTEEQIRERLKQLTAQEAQVVEFTELRPTEPAKQEESDE